MDCIFCKIVEGQIPCHKLYEGEHVLAFLDIGPVSRGHCLIIPKKHVARLDEFGEAEGPIGAAVMALAPRLGRAVAAAAGAPGATGVPGWNLLQNNGRESGQAVDHFHFHIIPRQEGDGLGFRWPAGSLGADDAAVLIEAITGELGE